MNLHRLLTGTLGLLLVSLFAYPSHADVPDPSLVSKLYPDVLKVGPPPAIKAGTRLTYYGGSATIPGVRNKLVPDVNGNWVDKNTGQKFGESEIKGSGGVGYTIVRIGHVDKEAVVVNLSNYLIDTLANTVSYTGGNGFVSNAGAASDYWIHPDILKKIPNSNNVGYVVSRMPYVIGNRKFSAIRFQSESASGHTAYMYDLDSGILLYLGSSAVGAGVITPGVNGQAAGGAGNTYISHSQLVEVKDVDIPWAGAPVPQWVTKFNELRYDGTIITAIDGVQPMTQRLNATLTTKAREDGWVRFENTITSQVPNFQPLQSKTQAAAGHASVGGIWISPQALAKLKVGQVIDSIDTIKTKTVVTDIGRGYVTISEIGQLHRADIGYDTTTGIMAGVTLQQRSQLALTTTQLRLSGQK